jgi:DNA-binding LytR/AlgR family response regulator
VTAISIVAYAGQRFAPDWRRRLIAATALAALASLILLPWYDLKALGAILAGALALAVAAARGLRRRRSGAAAGLAAALACALLMAWQRTAFLDRAYYLLLAAVLVALVVEQVANLRRARAERDRERARAVDLAARLARAEREGEAIVRLKDGTRAHRVAESDILSIRAADDYCDVALADGRSLLVTMSLAHFLAMLPARFVRVHKSHAVNRAHVTRIEPRPGGGRMLILSDGSAVPIGRSYTAAALRDLS